MVRYQNMVLLGHKRWLKIRNPNIFEKDICDDATYAWNRFRTNFV